MEYFCFNRSSDRQISSARSSNLSLSAHLGQDKITRRLRDAVLCWVAALAIVGCDTATEQHRYTILVSPKGLEQSFWLTVKAGADSAAAEIGVKAVWRGPARETDIPIQISILEDFITKKIDAIVLAACDEKALNPTLQKAVEAAIPIITIDSGVKSDLPLTFIATDNVLAAQKAADVLARLIGERGSVACIPIVPGAATSNMREKGFREGLQKHPDVRLVAVQYSMADVATAMRVTEDILTAHPDLSGIFAANEGGTLGVVQALKNLNMVERIKVVGFDAAESELKALREGIVQALIVQDPFRMGYLGVKKAVDAIEGRPLEKRIDTGVYVITRDNLGSPEIQRLLSSGR